jgi:DNA-binding LacI/PurR family transcriptional regulator
MTVIDKIAKKAKVSKCTVYRALKGQSKENWTSTKSRSDKIRKIAQDLGYRPNAAARSVREGSFKQVACVSTRIKGDHSSSLVGYLDAAADALIEKDYLMVFESFMLEKGTGNLSSPQKLFSQNSVDGALVLIASGYCPESIVSSLEALNIPIVWINYKPSMDACCILSEESESINDMLQHYKELGHKKIAYLAPEYSHYSVASRRSLIEEAGNACDLDMTILTSAKRPYICDLVNDLFDNHPDVTGVICYNKSFLDILMFEASKRSISIPRDLSVTFFIDPVEKSITKEMQVSAIELPHHEMVQRGTELLFDMIENKTTHKEATHMPAKFVTGATTSICKK